MPLNRRHFLQTAALTLGPVALTGHGAINAAAVDATTAPKRPALVPPAFLRLPPGSITARGWLAGQLRLQLQGLHGRYEERPHFLDFGTTGWVHPEKPGWEEVPYWLRGYVPLAIATGDGGPPRCSSTTTAPPTTYGGSSDGAAVVRGRWVSVPAAHPPRLGRPRQQPGPRGHLP